MVQIKKISMSRWMTEYQMSHAKQMSSSLMVRLSGSLVMCCVTQRTSKQRTSFGETESTFLVFLVSSESETNVRR